MTSTENPIAVRQVTDVHANWSDQGDGEAGKFSFQLILDNGAAEAVIRPSAQAAKVIVSALAAGKTFTYDVQREVLLLRGLK